MSEAFLKVVNMSISAGWLVLAVLALRLILKKAPKWVNVLLWGIVAIRLICPFSIESALSLIPSRETISPEIMMDWTPEISTGIDTLDQVVNPVISTSFAPNPGTSANPLQILIPVAANLWLLGVIIMLAYTAISYLTLRRKLRTAVILRGNIFQCETVSSPFVLGILKPRIYLPYSMDGQNLHHVVAHEQAHIWRKDHWWKPLGFLLLTVYWFNPLMWVAYILLCRDIELACDEKVIAELGNAQRADYTQALVACAVNRRMIAACPLAFGEVGVKDRVKSIMNYRKPTFWIIVTALVVCIVVAVCFLTDPNPSREFSMNGNNISDLNSEMIVDRILDIEDWNASNIYVYAGNFSLQVDSDFNWVDSQAIQYFFSNSEQNYSAQLRIFPDEAKYFLTEPSEWNEIKQIFLMRHYLDALKYLPQEAIREMAPADQYIIQQREEGIPSDYTRVISYSSEGVEDTDGWYIHLQIQPLHEVDGQFHGTGDEVLDVFYGESDGSIFTTDSLAFGLYNLDGENADITEIRLRNLHNGKDTVIQDDDAIESILTFIARVEGTNPTSSKGYYGGSYDIQLMNGSQTVFSIGFGDDDSFNFGGYGDGYPARYELRGISREDVIRFFSQYDSSNFDWGLPSVLKAKLLEIHDNYYIVEPVEGSWELSSVSKLEVPMKNMEPSPEPQVGDILEIEYDGQLQETYPARITAVYDIRVISERPHVTEALTLNEVAELVKQQHTVSFVGMTREAVHGYWGVPDAQVHGFFGDIYHVPDSTESVIFRYDDKEIVESVIVEHRNDSEDWGLTVRLQFESETEFDIILTHFSANQTVEGTITTSPEYEIKVVHNGEIISFGNYMRNVLGYDYADTVIAWDTVLYSVETNGELIIDCNISAVYGLLPAGEYILYKPVQLTTKAGATIIKEFAIRFTIVSAGTELHIPEKDEILLNGYPINALGESYGPDIKESDVMPDLILVRNEMGVLGYIRASELEGNLPTTPNDALDYEPVRTVNMYLQDGITVVGQFRLS